MESVDLGPAVQRITDLITNVPDDKLEAPTPCAKSTLGDLIDHVGGFSLAFRAAAAKEFGDLDSSRGPSANAANLGDDWRTRIPRQLEALADAWRDPSAWTGMTKAGGLDLPGEVAGVIALDELVVHGWDIARASGQPYDCEPASVEAAMAFVQPIAESGEAPREGLFGPPVPVPADAPALDRLVGMTGRDPAWTPT
jgi:uncharacterized protein (TIGR03086 family)